MSVMTAPEFWFGQGRMLTVDDMEDMPDDEYRYELDDGMLVVSPAPSSLHQLAVARVHTILTLACPAEFLVLPGPGINFSRFQHRIPDVAVLRWTSFREPFPEDPPVLAVEVASPRTRVYDRGRKKDVYEKFGVAWYWIVEPDEQRPSLTVFGLRRGRYAEMAQVTGEQPYQAAGPFPVTVVPASLVARPAAS
jgi:Uma2 family endonuclease